MKTNRTFPLLHMRTLALVLSLFFLWMANSEAHAQTTFPPNLSDPRANFTEQFKNRPTVFVYTDENDTIQIEPYTTQIGLYNRWLDAMPLPPLSQLGNPPASLSTAPLAAEHHWMSFELLMKAQRELAACIQGINEHNALHQIPPIDAPGQPDAEILSTVREYWVPFNVLDNGKHPLPDRETYIKHFEVGIIGLNQAIAYRDWCRNILSQKRAATNNYIDSIWNYVILLETTLGLR